MPFSTPDSIRLIVVDDDPITLRALIEFFQAEEDFNIVGSFTDLGSALTEIRKLQPEIVLCGFPAQGAICLDFVTESKTLRTKTEFVFISSVCTAVEVLQALRLGATAFVSKADPPDTIVSVVRYASTGRAWFSPTVTSMFVGTQDTNAGVNTFAPHLCPAVIKGLNPNEVRVLEYVYLGYSNKEISRKLQMTLPSVKKNVSKLLSHYNVASRAQLGARLRELKP